MNDPRPLIFIPLCIFFLFKVINCSYPILYEINLNCGSAQNSSFNGVSWTGDVGSPFLLPNSTYALVLDPAAAAKRDIPTVPYSTARLFASPFTYSFPTSPGLQFITLHFYPIPHPGLDHISRAYFCVTVGIHTLLYNFNPSVLADKLQQPFFMMQFAVQVNEHVLNISFVPSPNVTGAFGFVNGIMIKSMAFNPYSSLANGSAFEVMHKVSVGAYIFDTYMIGSMTGTRINTFENITYDSEISEYESIIDYSWARIMGSDDAVNMNYNLTWEFPVDSGFKYFIRLHFCEISPLVNDVNQRVFKVYVDNVLVEKSLDLVGLFGKPYVATFRDYFVNIPKDPADRQTILLELHPNVDSNPKFTDAILNGVEIVKLSDRNHNLAAFVELKNEKRKKKIPSRLVLSTVAGGFVFLCSVFLIFKKVRKFRAINKLEGLSISSGECRQFALADIRVATNNFSEALVIGQGGFGKVYKGKILIDETTEVAIKRRNPGSSQGFQEFQNEIELLSSFRHMNLVSLLGFCQEANELILVYDYMARGTLRDHLYKTQNPPLPWIRRLHICIGAARGLHYLHTGAKHTIIHRDIKSTNILLDEDWTAKVSDFGLSRIGCVTASSRYVSTEVKGTFGYLDPRYYQSRKLTEKSDVYSFGVVLFEVLCAMPAVNLMALTEEEENISLAELAIACHQNNTIQHIVDPCIRNMIEPECLDTFVDIAVSCLADRRVLRPSMGDVLDNLDKALQFQERLDSSEGTEDEQLAILSIGANVDRNYRWT